jgi:uncharacterized protein (TIGR03437 family)
MSIVRALAAALCATGVSAQVITTIAGTGFVFPNSVPSLNAPLGHVYGVATDASGNVYAADSDNQIIIKIAPSGTLTVVAGNGLFGATGDGGPATDATLDHPLHVAVDSAGNVYFDEYGRIRKVSAGIVTTIAGNGSTGTSPDGPAGAPLGDVSGLAVDGAGTVYFAESDSCRIRKIVAGTITTIAGNGTCGFSGDGGPATSASINSPTGLVFDSAANLYIADEGNGRIRKVSAGAITTVAGGPNGDNSGTLTQVTGITVNASGVVHIAAYANNQVYKVVNGVLTPVAGNGQAGLFGDGGPATAAALNSPYGIAFDAVGNLYIADVNNMRVRRVNAAGIIGPAAGNGGFKFSGDGGPAISANFNAPPGVAMDGAGNLYIADATNNRIRKVANGIVTTFAGNGAASFAGDGGLATDAALNNPMAVAVDATGAVYIADTNNQRIRKVSGGTITTIAGNGNSDFSGDGGPATAAAFGNPVGIAVDATGNIYVADSLNQRIRRISNGNITTIAGNGTAGFSGDGGAATGASLNLDQYYFDGVAVDAAGSLYIADGQNLRIRKVTFGGGIAAISTVAGTGKNDSSGDGGPATGAGLSYPAGVAVDPQGNLYIAEYAGNRVRKVSNGTIASIAGNGSYSSSGDGGLGTAAGVLAPAGLALDSAGDLFIAETGSDRVREVLKTAPSFQVSRSTFNISAMSGGLAPAPSVTSLSSTTPGLTYTTFASANWLSASPATGSLPAALQLSVDPSQLAPGTYFATVSISAPNARPTTQTVMVNLTVGPPVASGLTVSSQSLSFAVTQGASQESSQLTVLNQGSGKAGFTAGAMATGGNWLQVSPTSGAVTASTPASLTVTVTPGTLAAGTYSGAIQVSSADTGQNLAIPVTLAVGSPRPEILLSQSGMTFTAVAQGGTVLPQDLAILNTGSGALNWQASVFTSPPASGWLGVSTASGTVNRPFLDVSTVEVSIDASGLSAGTYYGQVQISSAGASNSPQIALVILNVLPPGSNPGPDVSPIGLVFTGVAGGGSPDPQIVAVANVTGHPVTFGSSVAYPGAGNWIQYRPTNSTVLPNSPTQITIQPDFSSLSAGSNLAALTLAFDDNTIRTVSVLAVLAPAGSAPGARSTNSPRAASVCTPTKLLPQFTLIGYSANVTAGYPAVVAAKIVDDCGVPVTDGTAVVSFSNGDPQLSLLSLQDGTWTNSWQPGAGAANVTLALRASQPSTNLTGSTQAASVGLQQGGQTPPILSGAPLGAGTLAQGPFSPGDVMLVRGSGLSDGQSSATGTPLQNQLSGASLVIGSKTAPLLYADSGMVMGLVPPDVSVNASQQVLLVRDNTYGTPVSVIIAPTHPAVLTADGSGKGQGLVYKGSSAATALANGTNPAAAGDAIIVYCTGLGAIDSGGRVTNSVTLTIGGQAAQVTYAGIALPQSYPPGGAPSLLGVVSAGLGGLYQINATAPGGLASGSVAVSIGSAGQSSQSGVTLVAAGGGSAGGVPAISMIANSATGQANDAKHGSSPNSFVSVYASNIGTTANAALFPATSFQGLQVLFNGKATPLYSVTPSANQINLVAPSELTGSTATVNVQNASGLSSNFTLTLSPDSVGVFRIPDPSHPNNGAVQIAGTTWDVLPASTASFYGFPSCAGAPAVAACAQPAKPGDNIVLYFTGGGLATPNGDPSGQPVPTGSLAPVSGNPLYRTVQMPTLTIGGIPAPIQFSGIAPGTAAEYQLNTQIPAGTPPGDSISVVVTFPNSSDTVTIAVQSP